MKSNAEVVVTSTPVRKVKPVVERVVEFGEHRCLFNNHGRCKYCGFHRP